MKEKIVIALGGNALGNSPEEQLKLVKKTAKTIVDLKAKGYDILVSHGNGPQVGMINLGMEFSFNNKKIPNIPFPECGAMSQGYIGYHLQQAIQNELKNRKINVQCATIITQVVVDKNDLAFKNPTKPIGSFYSKEDALKIEKETGYIFKEDSGRGYRRVVASPYPIRIVEIKTIEELVNAGNIVIACGGGGIPVIETDNELIGVPAVIDKDRSSAKLAEDINADKLVILTAVDKVSINFNKPNQKDLDVLSLEEAINYSKNGEFGVGSMLPKVESCINFVKNTGKCAIISSLNKADQALSGENGTIIKN